MAIWAALFCAILGVPAGPPMQKPSALPPRVSVHKAPGEPGAFLRNGPGAPFTPKGFNHTVLQHGDAGWHATFNVGVYDPDRMEDTLAAMADLGANTIRVWAWGVQDETGFTGGPEGQGLNAAYMANFTDFLARAARHGIYVIAILDEVPVNAHYNAIRNETPDPPGATGYNRQFLAEGPIAAKCAAAADFVAAVKEAGPGLLHAVLAWELGNEVHVYDDQWPFDQDSGVVTIAGGTTYDMADGAARRACYDEGIVHWSNRIADAIKAVDPAALVTAGMWTVDAHGRVPGNGLFHDGKDARRPPRPSVLAGDACALDFIDVHIYPWDGTATVRPEAHEIDAVMGGRKPAIVGEYGVFKDKSAEEACTMMRDMVQQAHRMGYIGDLHWIWDLHDVPGQTWSAVEEGIGAYVMGMDRGE